MIYGVKYGNGFVLVSYYWDCILNVQISVYRRNNWDRHSDYGIAFETIFTERKIDFLLTKSKKVQIV